VAGTIVPKFKRNKRNKSTTWLKIELPVELKTRLDIIVAGMPEESLKSYVTQIVLKAVEAEERRRRARESAA
jgi:hypothetical protein